MYAITYRFEMYTGEVRELTAKFYASSASQTREMLATITPFPYTVVSVRKV